jgi:hypothetical protein
VRTTLNIDDTLYRQVKAYAALRGASVTSVVEESLRLTLLQARQDEPIPPMPVSHHGGGLTKEFIRSGVDLNDTSALLDLLDQA